MAFKILRNTVAAIWVAALLSAGTWLYIPAWSSWNPTTSIEFDSASSQKVSISGLNEDGSQAWSEFVWVEPASNATQWIMGNLASQGHRWFWGTYGGGWYAVDFWGSVGRLYIGYHMSYTGGWSHVGVTFDPNIAGSGYVWSADAGTASDVKLYVGGIRRSVDVAVGTLPLGTITGTTAFWLGGDGGGNYGSMRIRSYVRVNKVLSPTEVTELYNGGTDGNVAAMSFWSGMKDDTRAVWVHGNAADLEAAGGVLDQKTSNQHNGSGSNLSNATDLVADKP